MISLSDSVDRLSLEVCAAEQKLNNEVTGGYASDLLSYVMARAKEGDVWVTMQVHVNIVAVAVLKELAAIILVSGRNPAEDTLRRAIDEHVTILVSHRPAFETIGMLYDLGIARAA